MVHSKIVLLLLFLMPAFGYTQGNVIVGEGAATNNLTLRANSNLAYFGLDIVQDGSGDAGVFFTSATTSYTGIGMDQDLNLLKLGHGFDVPGLTGLAVNSAGNVAIGATNPASKLDVNGQIRMRTGAANGHLLISDANGLMTWTNPAALGFGTFMRTGSVLHNNGNYATDDFVVGSSTLDNTGQVNRMFFDKSKGVFRAGEGTGTNWNDTNNGQYSFAANRDTWAKGTASSAFGQGTRSNGFAGTVVGLYNATLVNPQTTYSGNTPLFIVGNGNNDLNRSNALIVRKDGRVGITEAQSGTGFFVKNPEPTGFVTQQVTNSGSYGFALAENGTVGFNWWNANVGFYLRNSSDTLTHTMLVHDATGDMQFSIEENGNSGFGAVVGGTAHTVRNPSVANARVLGIESSAGALRFGVEETGHSGFNGTDNTATLLVRNAPGNPAGILQVETSTGVSRLLVRNDGASGFNNVTTATLTVRSNTGTGSNKNILLCENSAGTGRFYVNNLGTAGVNVLGDAAFTVRNAPSKPLTVLRVESAVGTDLFMVDKFGNLLAPSLPFGDHANMQYRTSDGLFFYDNSSRRYKRNIRPLRTDFRLILQAEPKTYTRPADPDRWEVGYIAEEMDSLGLTELVSYDKKGIPDGFNYEKMILYVNEILKDHDAQLHELHLKLEQRDKLIEKQAAVIELLLSREQYGVSADRQMTEAAQK